MTDASGTEDLRGAARQLGLGALLYVPVTGETRTLFSAGSDVGATALLDAAEQAGRRWLANPTRWPEALPPVQDASSAATTCVGVRDVEARLLGVVVASKAPDMVWRDGQRTAVHVVVEARVSDVDRRATAPRRPERAAALREALGSGELALVYQPEFELLTHRIVAVEALARWRHPQLGEIGPEWFIAVAEESDLIDAVGRWAITTGLGALVSWRAGSGAADLVLRVNVSPSQLTDEFAAWLVDALATHDLAGTQLCLELTEDGIVHDLDQVARTLQTLREHGVTSAMDDVAAGYSSLARLRHLPVDTIKIDRSLVAGLHADRRAQAIVTALVGLSLNFGVVVVAEGVEDRADLDVLPTLGCTRAQGHLLARPMAADAIGHLLRDQGTTSTVSHVL